MPSAKTADSLRHPTVICVWQWCSQGTIYIKLAMALLARAGSLASRRASLLLPVRPRCDFVLWKCQYAMIISTLLNLKGA